MNSAFVTGGSGFVGRNLIAMLRQRGWQVRALARSDAAVKAVSDAGAEPVRGDLDQAQALAAGMRGCMPDGSPFEGVGIAPDVVVEMTPEDLQKGRDPQLAKAVELLKPTTAPKR